MKKFMSFTGAFFTLISVGAVSAASWMLFHSEEVPQELK
ncbi:cyclic lactone autoinducer peptide [Paenibacillus sp. JSM ZJ436]